MLRSGSRAAVRLLPCAATSLIQTGSLHRPVYSAISKSFPAAEKGYTFSFVDLSLEDPQVRPVYLYVSAMHEDYSPGGTDRIGLERLLKSSGDLFFWHCLLRSYWKGISG